MERVVGRASRGHDVEESSAPEENEVLHPKESVGEQSAKSNLQTREQCSARFLATMLVSHFVTALLAAALATTAMTPAPPTATATVTAAVPAVAWPSLREQLGDFRCDHPRPATGEGTLVIIMSSVRGKHITWASFRDNVLIPLRADLALVVGNRTLPPDWGGYTYQTYAKYVWTVEDPRDNDYRYYFDDIGKQCFGRGFPPSAAKFIGEKLPGHFLGLIKDTGHATASAILLFYRWLALIHLEKNNVLGSYSHIVLTRSDYFYIHPHPQVSHIKPGEILLPEDKEWLVTDRHTVMHASDVPRILQIGELLVRGSPEEAVQSFKNLNKDSQKKDFYWNTEGTLRVWYASLKLNMVFFPQVAFLIYDADDGSTQRYGNLIPSPSDPIVPCRVHPKYPNEYQYVRQNAWPLPVVMSDLPPPDNRSEWKEKWWGPDALMEWTPNKIDFKARKRKKQYALAR